MRGFLIAGLMIVGFALSWTRLIVHDGLIKKLDAKPDTWAADTILYWLGQGHELFNNNQKALGLYQRIMERYPESKHAEDAHFGVALGLERDKDYAGAIAEYQKFLEKYPDSRYAKSVRNNIEILKSR